MLSKSGIELFCFSQDRFLLSNGLGHIGNAWYGAFAVRLMCHYIDGFERTACKRIIQHGRRFNGLLGQALWDAVEHTPYFFFRWIALCNGCYYLSSVQRGALYRIAFENCRTVVVRQAVQPATTVQIGRVHFRAIGKQPDKLGCYLPGSFSCNRR